MVQEKKPRQETHTLTEDDVKEYKNSIYGKVKAIDKLEKDKKVFISGANATVKQLKEEIVELTEAIEAGSEEREVYDE